MKTLIAVLGLLVLSTIADAQTVNRNHLLYAEAGTYGEFGYRGSYLTTLNGGYVFFHRPRIWFAGEANMFRFWNPDYSTLGIGLRPSVRVYPLQGRNVGLYAEIKGGPIYMLPEFRQQAINYTLLTSLGADVRISPGNSLFMAAGYTHYSNGKRRGDARNPTWDGIGGQVGITHSLR